MRLKLKYTSSDTFKNHYMLSKEEIARYSRHLILPDFTIEGQRKLKQGKVLVIGAGGLGSPMLQYLAAAGVGTIGIVDPDVVDETNLQRQVLYGMNDLNKAKVEAARQRLKDLNPNIEYRIYQVPFTRENALELIKDYGVVADGTDNFPTRYLVNDACVLSGKPNVYASVFRFEGQVSVFNYVDDTRKRGPNYRDLYPTPPPPGMVPSCAEGGVLGVLPGIIGSMQALEVIKILCGIGEPLSGRLFLLDALDFSVRILNIPHHPANPLTGEHPSQTDLIDYQEFCGMPQHEAEMEAPFYGKCITATELARWRERQHTFQLIDVREPYEYEIANLGGQLIPQKEIIHHLDQISRDIPVVLHCRSGARSARTIQMLEQEHGFDNLYNLSGGLIASSREVDPDIPVY